MSETKAEAAVALGGAHDAGVAIGEQTPADKDLYERRIALQKAQAIASAEARLAKAHAEVKEAEKALALAKKENA